MNVDTLFLAQILGVYMLVAGLSGLLHPARAKKALDEFARSKVLPYFDGALALLAGLLIVLTHNVWEGLPAMLVSLVGWLALLEGFAMLLLPESSLKSVMGWFGSPSVARLFGLVAVVLGAYFTYVGFF